MPFAPPPPPLRGLVPNPRPSWGTVQRGGRGGGGWEGVAYKDPARPPPRGCEAQQTHAGRLGRRTTRQRGDVSALGIPRCLGERSRT